jgi:hypothetical protein
MQAGPGPKKISIKGKYLLFINKYLLLLILNKPNCMSQKSDFIFKVLHIVAWIIFVGLSIEAVALLVNFFFSLYRPEIISRLYQKMDLSELYQRSHWLFYCAYSFLLSISLLKAYLFYVLVKLSATINLAKPFTVSVAELITRISYYTFAIGIFSYMARQFTKKLTVHGLAADLLNPFWADSQAFILMAAVIFVIAAIFRKGVDLQTENELTV